MSKVVASLSRRLRRRCGSKSLSCAEVIGFDGVVRRCALFATGTVGVAEDVGVESGEVAVMSLRSMGRRACECVL